MFLWYRLWEMYVNIYRLPWSSSFGHLSRHNLVNFNLYASQHWRISNNPGKRVDSQKKKYLHNCIELHVYLLQLIFYIIFLSKISLFILPSACEWDTVSVFCFTYRGIKPQSIKRLVPGYPDCYRHNQEENPEWYLHSPMTMNVVENFKERVYRVF